MFDESVMGMLLGYFLVIILIASRMIAGAKLTRLAGLEQSLINRAFSSMNYYFWMIGAPFILRHARLDGPAPKKYHP